MFIVAALYRFVPLADFAELRHPILDCMNDHGVRGTLLLAPEGINGTVAGTRQGIDRLLERLRSDTRFAALDVKESTSKQIPFRRARVRLKREIVTLGVDGIDPLDSVGTYVDPKDWNALIDDPDVTLIDTRNDYEVAIGTFEGATNPNTQSFRDFPDYVDQHLDPQKQTKVAMFCTGGIRCEKSTALLKQRGFDQVYHLRGGILKYLEQIPAEESRWHGDCFVFDDRVAVGQDLQESEHVMCYGCGWPVSKTDQQHPSFRNGVHCPHCKDMLTDEQIRRFATRQEQIERGKQMSQEETESETSGRE